ncbi:hypothetical protein TrRE_jg4654, partial [Triparma retinervis]
MVSSSRPSTLPPKEDKNPTFLVKARERTLYLRSDRAADADRWVRMVQMQCDLRNGGTSQGPKCEKNQKKTNGGGDKFELLSRELDKLLENVEQVELEVNSPAAGRGGMRKGRMGGGGLGGVRGNGGTRADITIDDGYDCEEDRKFPAQKNKKSMSLSIRDEAGRKKKEADSWGGRVDFDNDKSILEPVSPRHGPSSPGHSPPSRSTLCAPLAGQSAAASGRDRAVKSQGIKVRRKRAAQPSAAGGGAGQDPREAAVSPPQITYTTPAKEGRASARSKAAKEGGRGGRRERNAEGKDEGGEFGGSGGAGKGGGG